MAASFFSNVRVRAMALSPFVAAEQFCRKWGVGARGRGGGSKLAVPPSRGAVHCAAIVAVRAALLEPGFPLFGSSYGTHKYFVDFCKALPACMLENVGLSHQRIRDSFKPALGACVSRLTHQERDNVDAGPARTAHWI